MKSNGHDTSTSRVNGHGPVPPSRAAHEDMDAPLEPGRAASDDARDIPSAAVASSASAGTERDACAEAAPPPQSGTKRGRKRASNSAAIGTPRAPSEKHANRKTRKRKDKDKKKDKDKDKDKNKDNHGSDEDLLDIPPGSEPLPEDGLGFVDAIHEHVDLYLACARLVKAKDPKISQRMVERLLEMSYGKAPAAPEEQAPQIIFDAPRPIRD